MTIPTPPPGFVAVDAGTQFVPESSSPSSPPPLVRKRRKWPWIVGAALLATLSLGFVGVGLDARKGYFVDFSDNKVVIRKGHIEPVLWFRSTIYRRTGIDRTDLPRSIAIEIAGNMTFASADEASAFVDDLLLSAADHVTDYVAAAEKAITGDSGLGGGSKAVCDEPDSYDLGTTFSCIGTTPDGTEIPLTATIDRVNHVVVGDAATVTSPCSGLPRHQHQQPESRTQSSSISAAVPCAPCSGLPRRQHQEASSRTQSNLMLAVVPCTSTTSG